jgi:pilus assembly protein CpaB
VVILLALVCGISAAAGIQQLQNNAPETAAAPEVETVNVVVAAVDLRRGTRIEDAMVYVRPWPKSEAPPEAIGTAEEAVGKLVSMDMLSGDVVVLKKITKTGGNGIPDLIKPGYRAFTIPTPPALIKAGFLLPGNHVDVLLTLKSQNYGRQQQQGDNINGLTVVLVSDVEIIAAGKELSPPAGKEYIEDMPSVTLQVTPQQASLLELGRTEGTLSMTLRNNSDHADAKDHMVKRIDFLRRIGVVPPEAPAEKKQAKPAAKVAEAPKPKIELASAEPFTGSIDILRGTHRGRYNITIPGARP